MRVWEWECECEGNNEWCEINGFKGFTVMVT